MKLILLISSIFHTFNKQHKPKQIPNLPSASTLSDLCNTKQFKTTTSLHVQSIFKNIRSSQEVTITNWTLIKLVISAYPLYFIAVVVLGILAMINLIAQPFINDELKRIIGNKFTEDSWKVAVEVVLFFLGIKIVTCLLSVITDYYDMIYGVKIYNAIALSLIKTIKGRQIDSKFIACLEDDCERLQLIPYAIINSLAKVIQGIALSTVLITKLPTDRLLVSLLYWLFFILSLVLAFVSSKLNLKVMKSKQKRIQFGNKTSQQISLQRKRQLKQIQKIMIVEGVNIILPWFINVGLMATVYGIVGLDDNEKYFVLFVLGILRISISGLGSNMCIFSQAWSSLTRISSYLNQKYVLNRNNQPQQQQSHLVLISQSSQSSSVNKTKLQQKHFPISQLLFKIKQLTPNLFPILIFLSLLIFTANFMYGYTAKSLLMGQSIFSSFNIATLVLQLLSPILLYAFVCVCNIRLSKNIYQILLGKADSLETNSNQFQSQIKDPSNFTPEQINRLSGDIKLLDRQLYSSGYGFIARIMGILSSFLYSVVTLNNPVLIVIVLILIFIALWLGWMCRKFMTIRKQCYRKSAVSKGKLLKSFTSYKQYFKPWKQIYGYKSYGYVIEMVYITVLQSLLILLATLVVIILMVSAASVEATSVVVMLISQLDTQFLLLFIEVIYLQTITAAVCRCFSMLKMRKKQLK